VSQWQPRAGEVACVSPARRGLPHAISQ